MTQGNNYHRSVEQQAPVSPELTAVGEISAITGEAAEYLQFITEPFVECTQVVADVAPDMPTEVQPIRMPLANPIVQAQEAVAEALRAA